MKLFVMVVVVAGILFACSFDNGEDTTPPKKNVICLDWITEGISVEVRDAVTGLPAACAAEGKAENAGGVETLDPAGDCRTFPDALYLSGVWTPGTYTVTIVKPGYQDWRVGGIEVLGDVCGLFTVELRADLTPI